MAVIDRLLSFVSCAVALVALLLAYGASHKAGELEKRLGELDDEQDEVPDGDDAAGNGDERD